MVLTYNRDHTRTPLEPDLTLCSAHSRRSHDAAPIPGWKLLHCCTRPSPCQQLQCIQATHCCCERSQQHTSPEPTRPCRRSYPGVHAVPAGAGPGNPLQWSGGVDDGIAARPGAGSAYHLLHCSDAAGVPRTELQRAVLVESSSRLGSHFAQCSLIASTTTLL